MRRGFKAEAERLAAQVRTEMGLGPYKPPKHGSRSAGHPDRL